eukprot:77099-Pyramimonas_sp.AAC.1
MQSFASEGSNVENNVKMSDIDALRRRVHEADSSCSHAFFQGESGATVEPAESSEKAVSDTDSAAFSSAKKDKRKKASTEPI